MTGTRFASGDLDRASRGERPSDFSPAAVRRLKEFALSNVKMKEYGTALGRLYLDEKITSHEYASGQRWDELHRGYQAAIGTLKSLPKSLAIGEGGGGHDPDPETEAGAEHAKRDRAAIARFNEAHRVLCSAGMLAELTMRNLCEGDGIAPVGHEAFLAAKAGLKALTEYFSKLQKRT
jgi:hypothetical protein